VSSAEKACKPAVVTSVGNIEINTPRGKADMKREQRRRARDQETQEHEHRWREIMEQLGADVVRQRFTNRMMLWEPERYGGLSPPSDPFIVAWLREKDATIRLLDTRRFWIVAVIAFSTLIPAWIAAYPVLCRWLPATWTLIKKSCSE
jgi:hypothetical protein